MNSQSVPGCPACEGNLRHTEEDWKHHPLRGHGITKEWGPSHPDLESKPEATA